MELFEVIRRDARRKCSRSARWLSGTVYRRILREALRSLGGFPVLLRGS
ncbi:hypothetical protein ACQP00_15545 [Dactylosporangium sp. CS-047395]